MMRLKSKVAIVTGAATGIGQAIAVAFAREEASVTVDYIGTESSTAQTMKAIQEAGGKAIPVAADISSPADVNHLVSRTVEAFGRLDILVNNAGIEKKFPFTDYPLNEWQKIIAVNLTGPFLCAQAAAKQMIRQGGGGRIINISSIIGLRGHTGLAAYSASKAGMDGMTRALAREIGRQQITVNSINPGYLDTDAAAALQEVQRRQIVNRTPLGRLGRVEDVSPVVRFLLSFANRASANGARAASPCSIAC